MEQTEPKEVRRKRRKEEMDDHICRLNRLDNYKEKIVTKGIVVVSRQLIPKNIVEVNEQAFLTLVEKSRQPRYTDADIGKLFRDIVQRTKKE